MSPKKQTPTQDEEAADTREVRGIGDNSIKGSELKGFIKRLELTEKKKEQILQENRETFAEAKALGYDGKTVRRILRERKIGEEKAAEEAELLQAYRDALGMKYE